MKRHLLKTNFRTPTVQQNAACPSPPSKRVKEEARTQAEVISEDEFEEFLIIAEGKDKRDEAQKVEPGIEAGNVEAVTKSEHDNTVDSPLLPLRVTVKFKTSSGRVRTADDQPASMNYGDFLKFFGIPLEAPKRIEFKKSVDEWIVAVHDNMKLPLVDGCIVAETCTDF